LIYSTRSKLRSLNLIEAFVSPSLSKFQKERTEADFENALKPE
jgi:hypothetical protein